VARVCNCIRTLARKFMYIHRASIMDAYEASLEYAVKDLLTPQAIEAVTTHVRQRQAETEAMTHG